MRKYFTLFTNLLLVICTFSFIQKYNNNKLGSGNYLYNSSNNNSSDKNSRGLVDDYNKNKNKGDVIDSAIKRQEATDAARKNKVKVIVNNDTEDMDGNSILNYGYTITYNDFHKGENHQTSQDVDGSKKFGRRSTKDGSNTDIYYLGQDDSEADHNISGTYVSLSDLFNIKVKIDRGPQPNTKVTLDSKYKQLIEYQALSSASKPGSIYYSIEATGILTCPKIQLVEHWINSDTGKTISTPIGQYGVYNFYTTNGAWAITLSSILAPVFFATSAKVLELAALLSIMKIARMVNRFRNPEAIEMVINDTSHIPINRNFRMPSPDRSDSVGDPSDDEEEINDSSHESVDSRSGVLSPTITRPTTSQPTISENKKSNLTRSDSSNSSDVSIIEPLNPAKQGIIGRFFSTLLNKSRPTFTGIDTTTEVPGAFPEQKSLSFKKGSGKPSDNDSESDSDNDDDILTPKYSQARYSSSVWKDSSASHLPPTPSKDTHDTSPNLTKSLSILTSNPPRKYADLFSTSLTHLQNSSESTDALAQISLPPRISSRKSFGKAKNPSASSKASQARPTTEFTSSITTKSMPSLINVGASQYRLDLTIVEEDSSKISKANNCLENIKNKTNLIVKRLEKAEKGISIHIQTSDEFNNNSIDKWNRLIKRSSKNYSNPFDLNKDGGETKNLIDIINHDAKVLDEEWNKLNNHIVSSINNYQDFILELNNIKKIIDEFWQEITTEEINNDIYQSDKMEIHYLFYKLNCKKLLLEECINNHLLNTLPNLDQYSFLLKESSISIRRIGKYLIVRPKVVEIEFLHTQRLIIDCLAGSNIKNNTIINDLHNNYETFATDARRIRNSAFITRDTKLKYSLSKDFLQLFTKRDVSLLSDENDTPILSSQYGLTYNDIDLEISKIELLSSNRNLYTFIESVKSLQRLEQLLFVSKIQSLNNLYKVNDLDDLDIDNIVNNIVWQTQFLNLNLEHQWSKIKLTYEEWYNEISSKPRWLSDDFVSFLEDKKNEFGFSDTFLELLNVVARQPIIGGSNNVQAFNNCLSAHSILDTINHTLMQKAYTFGFSEITSHINKCLELLSKLNYNKFLNFTLTEEPILEDVNLQPEPTHILVESPHHLKTEEIKIIPVPPNVSTTDSDMVDIQAEAKAAFEKQLVSINNSFSLIINDTESFFNTTLGEDISLDTDIANLNQLYEELIKEIKNNDALRLNFEGNKTATLYPYIRNYLIQYYGFLDSSNEYTWFYKELTQSYESLCLSNERILKLVENIEDIMANSINLSSDSLQEKIEILQYKISLFNDLKKSEYYNDESFESIVATVNGQEAIINELINNLNELKKLSENKSALIRAKDILTLNDELPDYEKSEEFIQMYKSLVNDEFSSNDIDALSISQSSINDKLDEDNDKLTILLSDADNKKQELKSILDSIHEKNDLIAQHLNEIFLQDYEFNDKEKIEIYEEIINLITQIKQDEKLYIEKNNVFDEFIQNGINSLDLQNLESSINEMKINNIFTLLSIEENKDLYNDIFLLTKSIKNKENIISLLTHYGISEESEKILLLKQQIDNITKLVNTKTLLLKKYEELLDNISKFKNISKDLLFIESNLDLKYYYDLIEEIKSRTLNNEPIEVITQRLLEKVTNSEESINILLSKRRDAYLKFDNAKNEAVLAFNKDNNDENFIQLVSAELSSLRAEITSTRDMFDVNMEGLKSTKEEIETLINSIDDKMAELAQEIEKDSETASIKMMQYAKYEELKDNLRLSLNKVKILLSQDLETLNLQEPLEIDVEEINDYLESELDDIKIANSILSFYQKDKGYDANEIQQQLSQLSEDTLVEYRSLVKLIHKNIEDLANKESSIQQGIKYLEGKSTLISSRSTAINDKMKDFEDLLPKNIKSARSMGDLTTLPVLGSGGSGSVKSNSSLLSISYMMKARSLVKESVSDINGSINDINYDVDNLITIKQRLLSEVSSENDIIEVLNTNIKTLCTMKDLFNEKIQEYKQIVGFDDELTDCFTKSESILQSIENSIAEITDNQTVISSLSFYKDNMNQISEIELNRFDENNMLDESEIIKSIEDLDLEDPQQFSLEEDILDGHADMEKILEIYNKRLQGYNNEMSIIKKRVEEIIQGELFEMTQGDAFETNVLRLIEDVEEGFDKGSEKLLLSIDEHSESNPGIKLDQWKGYIQNLIKLKGILSDRSTIILLDEVKIDPFINITLPKINFSIENVEEAVTIKKWIDDFILEMRDNFASVQKEYKLYIEKFEDYFEKLNSEHEELTQLLNKMNSNLKNLSFLEENTMHHDYYKNILKQIETFQEHISIACNWLECNRDILSNLSNNIDYYLSWFDAHNIVL